VRPESLSARFLKLSHSLGAAPATVTPCVGAKIRSTAAFLPGSRLQGGGKRGGCAVQSRRQCNGEKLTKSTNFPQRSRIAPPELKLSTDLYTGFVDNLTPGLRPGAALR
jgi:hypothetical protein